ncbi:MAG: hypothetical protein V5B39_15335 [Accumulibacter sp.]|uniref:hypothetical protein n=1 Tax=Accumulibacter sp. TaxID=2053492 RepID=UPI002FC3197A
MSSPATVEYQLLRVLVAALENVAAENDPVYQRELRANRLAELQRNLASYRRGKARHAALCRNLDELRRRFPNHDIQVAIPGLPAEPDLEDVILLDIFNRETEEIVVLAEKELREAVRRLEVDRDFCTAVILAADEANSPPVTVGDLLAAYVRRAALLDQGQEQATRPEVREKRSAVLIDRVAELSATELAPEVTPLLEEFLATASDTRARMLETELKIRIGQLIEDRSRRARESEEARRLIDRLPPSDDSGVRKLVDQLSLVVGGEVRLTDALRVQVDSTVARLALAARQDEAAVRQTMAAAILSEALNDLGYEAEPIEKTLFAEGGMVHFHEAAWGDYYMRMRVSPERQQINFNLVRAAASGEHANPHRDDVRIENAWCSESGLKKLVGVLKDRGLDFTMVREIKAGSLPVQVVSPAEVPLQGRRDTSAEAGSSSRRQAPSVSKSIKNS